MSEDTYKFTLLYINVDMVKSSRDIDGISLFVTPDIFKYQFVCLYDIHSNSLYINRYGHASVPAFSKGLIGGILLRMRDLFGSEKFKRMLFFIFAVVFIIAVLSFLSRVGNETLTDYAEKNPDTAYAETDNSWRDAYDDLTVSGN
jgi:hypothetical protein